MSWKQGLQSSLSMESGDVVAQTVKCLSTMWETRVRALGWEDPLKKEMAIHSSIIAWKIPMDRGAWGLQSMGLKQSVTAE